MPEVPRRCILCGDILFNRKKNAEMCKKCSAAFRKGSVKEWEKRRTLIKFVEGKLEVLMDDLPKLMRLAGADNKSLAEFKGALVMLNKRIREVKLK